MTEHSEPRFVPAAGRALLTGLYDPVIALTMREREFRTRLAEQVLRDLDTASPVLVDVGSGTGTFAIDLAGARPDAEVIGVEPDASVLDRARRKGGSERVDWRAGMADALPLAAESADRVVCSLVLHHLSPAVRRSALREIHRVLRPGARVHVADWGRPAGAVARLGAWAIQRVDGVETTKDLIEGRLPELLTAAGFEHVTRHERLTTLWGTLELTSAVRA